MLKGEKLPQLSFIVKVKTAQATSNIIQQGGRRE